jgi:glycerol kinase
VAVERVLAEVGGPEHIIAAGLDNQGETVVAWSADDGRALGPAIVWQCRRSLPIVQRLRAAGLEDPIRARSGLPLDPYYSASKLTWWLEHDQGVRAAAGRGTLRWGTVDAWLTSRLGGGDPRTDTSTASRTQLLGLGSLAWDPELLSWFGIAEETLPRIVATVGDLGRLAHPSWGGSIPLRAMACDQQAAMAGHGAFAPGGMKATYGTGVFVLANAGTRREAVPDVETSIAWTLPAAVAVGCGDDTGEGGETTLDGGDMTVAGVDMTVEAGGTTIVLQGGVFTAGAFVDWLRDDLHLIDDAASTEALALSVPDTAGVRVLPALVGLGAPFWRPEARAVVAGLTAAATPAHVVRAALDGIAQCVTAVVDAMIPALAAPPQRLRVDGGLTANAYLMQRQADLLGLPVDVASVEESTALGIAGLAGLGAGVLDLAAIAAANPVGRTFSPRLSVADRLSERTAWRRFAEAASAL